ncbi:MAG: NADH-quinone oxidoreductase subunit N [Zavarzinella sp.]
MYPSPDFIDRQLAFLSSDLLAFLPEIVLAATIVGLLLLRIVTNIAVHAGYLAILGVGSALAIGIAQWCGVSALLPHNAHAGDSIAIFSNFLVHDQFGLLIRIGLLGFLVVVQILCLITHLPDRQESIEFSVLLCGSTLGLMLMSSSNHLMMMFLSIEMASLPGYILAGFAKGRRAGSEAAMKYVIYGASAAGIMLYGMSLLVVATGTASFPEIATHVGNLEGDSSPLFYIGAFLVIGGLMFKLAAFPFHFWLPDVFHGAFAEIGLFLSVASKAAALVLSLRFLFALTGSSDGSFHQTHTNIALMWTSIALLTTTFGNLAALGQSNIKRLLGYSTIAHAGVMMFAVLPFNRVALVPLIYYLAAYLLTNLGAFAVVAIARKSLPGSNIQDFTGLIKKSPILAISMTVFLMGLIGLPPLMGFAAKFHVFANLYHLSNLPGFRGAILSDFFYATLVLLALNTAISVAYYLRVIKVMMLDEPASKEPIVINLPARALLSVVVSLTLVFGIFWNPITQVAQRTETTFKQPALKTLRNSQP